MPDPLMRYAPPPDAKRQALAPGRSVSGLLEVGVERDADGQKPESDRAVLEVFCPLTRADYDAYMQEHADPEDPRDFCVHFRTVFHEKLRPQIEGGVMNFLQQVGYPAALPPAPIQLPDGTILPAREFSLREIRTAACSPRSPHSVVLIYDYTDLPPVIVTIPCVLVGRQVCGECEGCQRWMQTVSVSSAGPPPGVQDGVTEIDVTETRRCQEGGGTEARGGTGGSGPPPASPYWEP